MRRGPQSVCISFPLIAPSHASVPLPAGLSGFNYRCIHACARRAPRRDRRWARRGRDPSRAPARARPHPARGVTHRGLPSSAITVLGASSGERLRRDTVLAALKPTAKSAADDETWIILLGTSAARGGEPSFQSPALASPPPTSPLRSEPFRVAPSSSSPPPRAADFLPSLLALPQVEAVAATADSGEVNETRFAEAWAESLVATPKATFTELADSAAKRVETFYESASLAQGEHARLIDRVAGRIIEAPFAKSAAPAPTPATRPTGPTPGFSVADIEIPKPEDDTEITRTPATEETLALLAEARVSAKDSAYAALYLRRDIEVTVGRDFSVIERHRQRAFLRTGESLDELGTLMLPSSPPDFATRLEGVRIIKPDGSQVLVNPRAYDERRAADQREADDARTQRRPTGPLAPPFLPLPEVTAGCIIEAAWTIERRSSDQIPSFRKNGTSPNVTRSACSTCASPRPPTPAGRRSHRSSPPPPWSPRPTHMRPRGRSLTCPPSNPAPAIHPRAASPRGSE